MKMAISSKRLEQTSLVYLALQAEDLCTNMYSRACRNSPWYDNKYEKALEIS